MRTFATESISKIGKEISVSGWVNSRRDHGGIIFVDLRDHTGIVQLVFNPELSDFALAESLRDEFCVRVSGLVRERGAGLENPNIDTGKIEIIVSKLEILNKSETPVVTTHDDGEMANEDLRLKYRFLDLRRPHMQSVLKKRAEFNKIIRDYMEDKDFTEVATPILANSSPEGARDFLIPSRLHAGKFYALPQAPQQFKQLLMVSGVPKYYQIAPCFRDEDPRADRLYGDFYQLDLEMSFVEDGETVRTETEPLIKKLVTDFAGKKLLDNKVVQLTYEEAMNDYGTDKPDLRYDMKLIDLTDNLKNTEFAVFKNAECVKAICVKGGASLSRSQIDGFTEIAKKEGAGGLAYLTYKEGEIQSPIAKFLSETELGEITKKTGATNGDAVFFGADVRVRVNKVLGVLRSAFAEHFALKDPKTVSLAWVVDFPFYDWDEKNKRLDFGHNPFSWPKGGLEALKADDKLSVVADQFDMILNGYEICSGAVRNYSPEVMHEAFAVLGHDGAYVEAKFSGMLNAFKFGAPPHAGCAFGLDRMFMELLNLDSIRDTLAFPKNGSGVDVMMDSPSGVEPTQLGELSLKLNPKDK
ncbi:aspartate--tRNA ligase [Candidatus Saccharibacteria bacterium]|jgi:aspartyl-tRNA synthetase|nr:aspartate--tRNA ligase [Candidatus Saccharibacteria bacterium]